MENLKLKNSILGEILKAIPFTTLILTYLFICGVLYLLGYWGTFNIDVFSFIAIYDIPKNFVFPLLISQGFFFLNLITDNVAYLDDDRMVRTHFITINRNWKKPKRLFLSILTSTNLFLLLSLFLLLIFIPHPTTNGLFWSISSIIIAYYLLHKFVNIQEFRDAIESRQLRSFIGHLLIFLPISCFSTGKIESLKIYRNEGNRYINIISNNAELNKNDSDSLKFLGYIGDKIIYSSKDNKKTIILNCNSIDGIQLSK